MICLVVAAALVLTADLAKVTDPKDKQGNPMQQLVLISYGNLGPFD